MACFEICMQKVIYLLTIIFVYNMNLRSIFIQFVLEFGFLYF